MPRYRLFGDSIVTSPITITFEADSLEHAKELVASGEYNHYADYEYDDADETLDIDESSLELDE